MIYEEIHVFFTCCYPSLESNGQALGPVIYFNQTKEQTREDVYRFVQQLSSLTAISFTYLK
jgi:hypothetical protein